MRGRGEYLTRANWAVPDLSLDKAVGRTPVLVGALGCKEGGQKPGVVRAQPELDGRVSGWEYNKEGSKPSLPCEEMDAGRFWAKIPDKFDNGQ